MRKGQPDQARNKEAAQTGRERSAAGAVADAAAKKTLPAVIAIVAVISAIYGNALFNGFVYDDIPQVLENKWITSIRYLPDMFSGSVHSFQTDSGLNYYRPIMHVLYLFSHSVFGLAPWGFHLVNVLFHAGVSILVYLILLQLVEQPSTALVPPRSLPGRENSWLLSMPFAAAMLFATHPIHTEAVTWVAGIPDLSFSFFCLLSFYFYIESYSGARGRSALSLAAFAVGMFSKETAVTFPLLFPVYDYVHNRTKETSTLPWKRYAPYLAVIVFYLIMRSWALGGFAPVRPSATSSVGLINMFLLFMLYLEKLLLPVNLNFIYALRSLPSPFGLEGILSLCVFAAFVLAAVMSLRRQRLVFFGLMLIIVPLLPVFYVPGRGVNAFAERYLYLPSMGFVIIASQLFDAVRAKRRYSAIAAGAAILVVGLYSAGTVIRNAAWKNDITMFRDVVSKSPGSPHPHFYLGISYLQAGDYENAIDQLQTALGMGYRTGDVTIYYSLGVAFFNRHMMDKALEYLATAERIDPAFAETHFYLGMVYGNMRRIDLSIEQFRLFLGQRPGNAAAHFNLGLVYAVSGQAKNALEQFEEAVRLDPQNPLYRRRLDEAYGRKSSVR